MIKPLLKKIFLFGISLAFLSCGSDDSNVELLNSEPATIEFDQERPVAVYEPDDGEVIVFIGQDNDGINGYINANLPQPAGFTHYIPMQGEGSGEETIPALWESTATNWGAGPVCLQCAINDTRIDWTDTIVHLSVWMVGLTDDIGSGASDGTIRELARFLNLYSDIPFFIRPGFEFDYQYKYGNPSISAASYRAAYRRIIDVLREEGVENFTSVFSSAGMREGFNIASYNDWVEYYPGNDYVDWLGVSVFYTTQPQDDDDALLFSRAVNKPIFISEATPRSNRISESNGATVWNNYFTVLFDHAALYPQDVKAIAYINTNWDAQSQWQGQNWGDTRIENSSELSELWSTELSQDKYIMGVDEVYEEIRFIEE